MKAIFYARVSRDDLHCENQKIILTEWALRNHSSLDASNYFQETETTRKTRPIKEKVIMKIREGEFDTLVVTRLDRFARSLVELIYNVDELIYNGNRFVSILNGIDIIKNNYNASAQLMLHIFGAFAQFEREITRERTYEGLARAKALGKKLGRPKKKPLINLNI